MIDLVAMFIREIKAEASLSTVVGDRVFGYKIPAGADSPLIVVTALQSRPFTTPSTVWWDTMVTVDIHSEDPKESEALSQAALAFLPTLVGSHAEGVLADCQVDSSLLVVDDGWTPTRYRHVVTVDVTARNS